MRLQNKMYFCSPKKGGDDTMLIIPVKDGENIDRALKRFKRKFDRTGKMRELRRRQQFTKPSVAKRAQNIKASYIQGLRDAENI